MERIPEPDLMNEPEQALAYAQADFEQPHNMFIELFKQSFPGEQISGKVLDLGCGPADITIRFAKAFPNCHIDGIDGAENMLKHGRVDIKQQSLDKRIRLFLGYLPTAQAPRDSYDVIISNSLLHHLNDPMNLWQTVRKYAQPGTLVFIMDLLRPVSIDAAQLLVNENAANEPDILREDFFNSLCASYRVEEVNNQLQSAGLEFLKVEVVSDRHFIVFGKYISQSSVT
jgi:ubiquinone/menaquinone biosynthesis C-methylase UbiE